MSLASIASRCTAFCFNSRLTALREQRSINLLSVNMCTIAIAYILVIKSTLMYVPTHMLVTYVLLLFTHAVATRVLQTIRIAGTNGDESTNFGRLATVCSAKNANRRRMDGFHQFPFSLPNVHGPPALNKLATWNTLPGG